MTLSSLYSCLSHLSLFAFYSLLQCKKNNRTWNTGLLLCGIEDSYPPHFHPDPEASKKLFVQFLSSELIFRNTALIIYIFSWNHWSFRPGAVKGSRSWGRCFCGYSMAAGCFSVNKLSISCISIGLEERRFEKPTCRWGGSSSENTSVGFRTW